MLDLVAAAEVGTDKGNVADKAGVALPFFAALSALNFSFHAIQAMCPSPGLCKQYIPKGLCSNKCPSSHR
jgi:hypothetical protein